MKSINKALLLTISSIAFGACSTSQPENIIPQALPTISYQCESGNQIQVSYPDTENAVVDYLGVKHSLRLAVSASGARYVGGDLEWWTKGAQATLAKLEDDEANILENCSGE